MKHAFTLLAGGVIVYELVALVNRQDGDTISERTWAACDRPLVPFLAGMVAGHFFWQQKR